MLIAAALAGAALCSASIAMVSSVHALVVLSAIHGAFQVGLLSMICPRDFSVARFGVFMTVVLLLKALGYPACIKLLSEHVTSEKKASILGPTNPFCKYTHHARTHAHTHTRTHASTPHSPVH